MCIRRRGTEGGGGKEGRRVGGGREREKKITVASLIRCSHLVQVLSTFVVDCTECHLSVFLNVHPFSTI